MRWTCAVAVVALTLASSVLTGCSSTDPKPDQVAGTLAEADKAYWLQDTTKARHWIENAIAVLPDSPDTYENGETRLGAMQILADHGDYSEMVRILVPAKKNKALSGMRIDIDGQLGDAYDRLGQKAESEAEYKDQLADIAAMSTKAGTKLSGSRAVPFMLEKGMAEWCSGDHATGRADLLSLAATDKAQEADADNSLAYMEALSRENLPEAESLARIAVGKYEHGNPSGLAMCQDTLGWVLHQEGKDKEALSYCQLASNAIPDQADCTEHLGEVYEALGDSANAKVAYNKVLTIQPLDAPAHAGLARLSARQ